MMVGKNLNDNQLQQIVDKTILYLVRVFRNFNFFTFPNGNPAIYMYLHRLAHTVYDLAQGCQAGGPLEGLSFIKY